MIHREGAEEGKQRQSETWGDRVCVREMGRGKERERERKEEGKVEGRREGGGTY